MQTKRAQIIHLIQQGHISPEKVDAALQATNFQPSPSAWLKFIDHLLLVIGSLAITLSVVFFMAYNWDALGRFAKFGMVEILVALAIIVYCKFNKNETFSKLTLLCASILLGVLLAFYGQTYQTGADPWQLFFYWALLILPWVVIGRFAALWVVWLTLLNVAMTLYFMTFPGMLGIMFDSSIDLLWLTFGFNSLVLVVWELFAEKRAWLNERWAARLISLASGTAITCLAVHGIFSRGASEYLNLGVWCGSLLGLYGFYRHFRRDLFMLAGAALSTTVVVTCFVSKHVTKDFDAGIALLLAMLIIGLNSGFAIWLRKIHREWQS